MKFWKTFWACLLALVVSTIIGWITVVLVITGFSASLMSSPATSVTSSSVLRLDLGQVTDSPSASPFGTINFQMMTSIPTQSLYDVLRTIAAATTDSNIKGIYLSLGQYTSLSGSSAEEVRVALQQFRDSGKFIIAYQNTYSQLGYYLATVADKVYMNPQGGMQWSGLSGNIMFYKGLLDKLGVRPQIIRHGAFKAAVEPLISDKMSPANRLQNERLIGSQWNVLVDAVAQSRGLTADYLQKLADNLTITSPEDAVNYGLVDGLLYEDEVMDYMAKCVDNADFIKADTLPTPSFVDDSDVETIAAATDSTAVAVEAPQPAKVNIVAFADYMNVMPTATKLSRNKIGVIYADGTIVSGEGQSFEDLGSTTLVERIRKAREDKNIKAVVLRINSPGGDALAAEIMWRELELLKAEKPLIVSMGSVAASGGYYIAAAGDAILADKLTVTGSIGVFGSFMNVGDALRDKLGVTVDGVKTNTYSDMGSPFRDLNPVERQFIQGEVERVYTTFVNRVSDGRNLTFEQVDAIGQGRVWSCEDARANGLVDDFGGLLDAVAIAADRAGVADDFRISEVTDDLTGLMQLINGASAEIKTRVMKNQLGPLYQVWSDVNALNSHNGVRAEMPYTIDIR